MATARLLTAVASTKATQSRIQNMAKAREARKVKQSNPAIEAVIEEEIEAKAEENDEEYESSDEEDEPPQRLPANRGFMRTTYPPRPSNSHYFEPHQGQSLAQILEKYAPIKVAPASLKRQREIENENENEIIEQESKKQKIVEVVQIPTTLSNMEIWGPSILKLVGGLVLFVLTKTLNIKRPGGESPYST